MLSSHLCLPNLYQPLITPHDDENGPVPPEHLLLSQFGKARYSAQSIFVMHLVFSFLATVLALGFYSLPPCQLSMASFSPCRLDSTLLKSRMPLPCIFFFLLYFVPFSCRPCQLSVCFFQNVHFQLF